MAKKTKGWLDNYGEEANANEGSSSAPKGWMGEGYSNLGRNYSPAWGGQFQLGGNVMPGAVGFTYARTNSPAPSEGPYAKKTMPSAQVGKKLKTLEKNVNRYLEGPKSRGVDYSYDAVKKRNAKEPDTLRHAYTAMETSKAIQDKTGNIPILSNTLGFLGANALGIGHELVGLTDPRADLMQVKEGAEDVINNFVGSVAASIPFVSDKNKRKAIQYLSDKGILPDGTTAARGREYVGGVKYENGGLMSYYQHGLDWKPKTISRDGDEIPKNQNAQYVLPRYDMPRAVSSSTSVVNPGAQRTAQTVNRETQQVQAYQKRYPGMSFQEALQNVRIQNEMAARPKDTVKQITKTQYDRKNRNVATTPDVFNLNKVAGEKRQKLAAEKEEWEQKQKEIKSAEDAIKNNKPFTFPDGRTKTFDQMDKSEKAYVWGQNVENNLSVGNSNDYYSGRNIIEEYNPFGKLTDWTSGFAKAPELTEETGSVMPWVSAVADPALTIAAYTMLNPELSAGNLLSKKMFNPIKPIQDFGKIMTAIEEGSVGKYLEKKIKDKIVKGTADETKVGIKGVAENVPQVEPIAQVATPQISSISAAINKNGGSLRKYYEGGIIQDDMGQWAHPGEITQINSPYITMQGVPYPVLGISDFGDVQMMYPGEDYEYDGNSVTEFPMMKKGGGLCKDDKGNVVPCDKQRLIELGSDAYTAMDPFYETLYGAANKYKNERTGKVSDLNSARATAKAFLKHPSVLFMKRHSIPSELTSMENNPYGVQSYTTPIAGGWYPTQWAEPREERENSFGDWWKENIKYPYEDWNNRRKTRKGIRRQGRCFGANCTEDEMLDQSEYGGVTKQTKKVNQNGSQGWLSQYK